MQLHQALYFSRACVPDKTEQMNEILSLSQTNNKAANITGFLHREGDYFLQFLEGPKTPLNDTLAKIGRDRRHTEFKVLLFQLADKRLLPNWRMGWCDPNQLNLRELLEMEHEELDLTGLDPFDLVVFMINNAHCLLDRAN